MADGRPQRRSGAGGPAACSSSRAAVTVKGEWEHCTMSQGQLDRLSGAGYLPPPEDAYARTGLIAIGQDTFQESTPNPQENERVCFVPCLIRGLGFSIHPFLRGLLHFYDLQLHHLSPNSIFHIACYVTLWEAFLRCLPHFGLWRRYFYVQPRTTGNILLDYGGTVICRVVEAGYLDGSPKEMNKNW